MQLRVSLLFFAFFATGCGLLREDVKWKPPKYAKPEIKRSLKPIDDTLLRIPSSCHSETGFTAQAIEAALALAEREYAAGVVSEKQRSLDAVAYFHRAAGFAFVVLANADSASPDLCRADAIYTSALARLIDNAKQFGCLEPKVALTIPTTGDARPIPIRHRVAPWQLDDIDELAVVGRYRNTALTVQYVDDGLGVPLVGFRKRRADDRDNERFLMEKHPITLSALLIPDRQLLAEIPGFTIAPDCVEVDPGGLLLVNAMRFTHFDCGSGPRPIRRDLTAPLAFPTSEDSNVDLAWLGFRQPDLAEQLSGIFLIEPYQPGKIPVVFVHGLLSRPSTWAAMINGLRALPDVTRRFQFACYRYPTGDPFWLSAEKFRRDLNRFHQVLKASDDNAALDNMVMVGHSMGGLLARLQVSRANGEYWHHFTDREPEELRMSAETLEKVRNVFYFEPRMDFGRVIFIATPHRGAALATRLVGRVASSLVRRPTELEEMRAELVRQNPGQLHTRPLFLPTPSSIDQLAPRSEGILVLQQMPFGPGIHLHSIVGDSNGVPGIHTGDSVVPIRSARLAEAESEIDVHAEHTHVHRMPDSIAEVARILRLHAKGCDGSPIRAVGQ